jgi:hypothetical protein
LESHDEETIKVLNTTAKVLSEAGVEIEEIHPPDIEESFSIFTGLLFRPKISV